MTKYYLNIHHRDAIIVKDEEGNYTTAKSPVGHFYISLQEENKEPTFFGKYPKGGFINYIFGPGKIVSEDEQKTHEQLIKADKDLDTKHVYTKSIALNESEYNKALDFAKNSALGHIGDNFFLIGRRDCRHFVQDVWIATGRSLPFTVLFSRDELLRLKTAAAYHLLSKFGSRDIIEKQGLIVEAVSKDNIAQTFNLASDNFQEIDALNNPPKYIACYESIQLTKYFKVVVSPEVINNALVGVLEVDINNTIDSVTTAASVTVNMYNDTKVQVSSEMQKLITSFKLPNITGYYNIGYKGVDTHQVPIDYGYISDPSTMNQPVRWILNIHHSTSKGNRSKTNTTINEKEGAFYISLVSPAKTMFYGNDTEEHNNQETKDINTKSIALSWRQYEDAVRWANRYSKITQGDGNIVSTNGKDGRHFVQGLWHALGKPLYFTAAYTTDELLKLGTKCAKDLLSVYGSFDTMKHGQFIDKDLSKELLADRLHIDVDHIVGGGIGTYNDTASVKSFVVNVDKELLDKARALVINSFNFPSQCKIVTKHNNTTIQSENELENLYKNKNTNVTKLVGSLLQQYQWEFNDNILEVTKCRNNQQELKDEYGQRQPAMFYARRDLVENSFNQPSLANNKSFFQYILSGWGEPMAVHMWYVNKILICKQLGSSILGYNISDKAYDGGATLENNIIQHWNNALDLLSIKAELNSAIIPRYDYRTYNLITGTIYNTLRPLGFRQSKSSMGPDKSAQPYYELVCAGTESTDVDHHKHRHHKDKDLRDYKHADIGMHHGDMNIEDELKIKDHQEHDGLVSRDDTDHMMFSSARNTRPIGYNVLNWVKEKISAKLASLTSFNFFELVSSRYQSDEDSRAEERDAIQESKIASETVNNIHDMIMHTNILNDQDNLPLNHVPLLSNVDASTADILSTNDALNMNGTLVLANLVVHIMTKVKQEATSNYTKDTTVKNNFVEAKSQDYGYAHYLAYSHHAPSVKENADDIGLVGLV